MIYSYYEHRTGRRIKFINNLVTLVLLVATGYYVAMTPVETGYISWILSLGCLLLKCYLSVESVILITVTLILWIKTLQVIGFEALKGIPTMLNLGRLSATKQGWHNTFVFSILSLIFIAAWMISNITIALFFSLYTASKAFSDFVGSCRTAGVVFLSRSSAPNVSLQVELKEASLGLRVVSLLDLDNELDPKLIKTLQWNVYRTSDNAQWMHVIQKLMDIAQIIVLDTRVCSVALLLETKFALVPSRRHKVLSLICDDGRAPVLEEYFRKYNEPQVNNFPRFIEIQLLAEIQHRLLPKLYPRFMRGKYVPIQGQKSLGDARINQKTENSDPMILLINTINKLNQDINLAVQSQDMEETRRLMLALKVAIERIGSFRKSETFKPITAAIADSAAAFSSTGFAEAHALLESSIEAAVNTGIQIIPTLELGLNEKNPEVRKAFQRTLKRIKSNETF